MLPTRQGITFLGYRILKNGILLNRRSANRFQSKMKNYHILLKQGIWTQKEYQRHVEPLVAFTLQASAKGFRKKVLSSLLGQ